MADPLQIITELEALCEKATSGPWVPGSVQGRCQTNHSHRGAYDENDCDYRQTEIALFYKYAITGGLVGEGRPHGEARLVCGEFNHTGGVAREEDRALIIASRTALPAALGALRRALERVEHHPACTPERRHPPACNGCLFVTNILEPLTRLNT